MLHQRAAFSRITCGDELVDRIDQVFFIIEQIQLARAIGLVVVRRGRTGRGQLGGVLHHCDQLGSVANDDPVELAAVTRIVEVFTRQGVDRDLQADVAHHGYNTFSEVFVGGIVGLSEQNDVHIRPTSHVDKAVAIAVGQARCFQLGLGRGIVERIVNRRCLVIVRRAVIQATRIDRGERAFHKAVAQTLPVKAVRNGFAEVEVAVQLAVGLAVGIRLAPAIARQVREQRIANGARPKSQLGGRCRIGGLFQAFDEVFRLFKVGKVARTGHGLNVTVTPSRKTVLHLIQIGQLVTGFVNLPVIGIAAQHNDVVGAMFNHSPSAHDGEVHVVSREGFLERLVILATILGMLRLKHMGRAGAEVAVSHVVQHRFRESGGEGEREGVVIDVGINTVSIGGRRRTH